MTGPRTYGRYLCLINCRLHIFNLQLPHLAPNIFSCFSNHLGAVFFIFLLLLLPPSLHQWHHEGGNFFWEYDQSNWLFYVGYYLEVSSWLHKEILVSWFRYFALGIMAIDHFPASLQPLKARVNRLLSSFPLVHRQLKGHPTSLGVSYDQNVEFLAVFWLPRSELPLYIRSYPNS